MGRDLACADDPSVVVICILLRVLHIDMLLSSCRFSAKIAATSDISRRKLYCHCCRSTAFHIVLAHRSTVGVVVPTVCTIQNSHNQYVQAT